MNLITKNIHDLITYKLLMKAIIRTKLIFKLKKIIYNFIIYTTGNEIKQ